MQSIIIATNRDSFYERVASWINQWKPYRVSSVMEAVKLMREVIPVAVVVDEKAADRWTSPSKGIIFGRMSSLPIIVIEEENDVYHVHSVTSQAVIGADELPQVIQGAVHSSGLFASETGHFISSMLFMLGSKDMYSREHSERVARYTAAIAKGMGLSSDVQKEAYVAGLLHDVGKIGIPDNILNKHGKLTKEEFDIIRSHPLMGEHTCSPIAAFHAILPAIRGHHERVDGTGYPDGLKGDEIPLLARIMSVADSFDAMTSDRPYRKHLPLCHVHDIFREGKGRQWDTGILDFIEGNFAKVREYAEVIV